MVVCRECAACVAPGRASLERHGRRDPHRLKGVALQAVVAYLLTLDIRSQAELRAHKATDDEAPIEDLRLYSRYRCLLALPMAPTRAAQVARVTETRRARTARAVVGGRWSVVVGLLAAAVVSPSALRTCPGWVSMSQSSTAGSPVSTLSASRSGRTAAYRRTLWQRAGPNPSSPTLRCTNSQDYQP